MDKWILKIVAALAVLGLYWWTLVVRPVTLDAVPTGPGSLSVEESRRRNPARASAARPSAVDAHAVTS